jgi:hypothetical protein
VTRRQYAIASTTARAGRAAAQHLCATPMPGATGPPAADEIAEEISVSVRKTDEKREPP